MKVVNMTEKVFFDKYSRQTSTESPNLPIWTEFKMRKVTLLPDHIIGKVARPKIGKMRIAEQEQYKKINK